MSYLRAQDTINGAEGKATMKIGTSETDMFYIKSLEANFEKNKTEIKTLGKRGTQHKATGWNGTGSMTIYYVTSAFRKLAYDYAKNGKDAYFDITVTNDDPGTTGGKQIVKLFNCNLDSTVLAKLDVDSDAMEEDVDFTFDDFEIATLFTIAATGK